MKSDLQFLALSDFIFIWRKSTTRKLLVIFSKRCGTWNWPWSFLEVSLCSDVEQILTLESISEFIVIEFIKPKHWVDLMCIKRVDILREIHLRAIQLSRYTVACTIEVLEIWEKANCSFIAWFSRVPKFEQNVFKWLKYPLTNYLVSMLLHSSYS